MVFGIAVYPRVPGRRVLKSGLPQLPQLTGVSSYILIVKKQSYVLPKKKFAARRTDYPNVTVLRDDYPDCCWIA